MESEICCFLNHKCHAHLRFPAADLRAELLIPSSIRPLASSRCIHGYLGDATSERDYSVRSVPVETMPLHLVVTGYIGPKAGNGVQTQTSCANAFDQCAIQDHNAQLRCVQGHAGQGME